MFCKKRCSKKFCTFHRKTPVMESLFNKVAGLKTCNFIKKRLQHRFFPMKFAKSYRTPILKNICERLLLYYTIINCENNHFRFTSQKNFFLRILYNEQEKRTYWFVFRVGNQSLVNLFFPVTIISKLLDANNLSSNKEAAEI